MFLKQEFKYSFPFPVPFVVILYSDNSTKRARTYTTTAVYGSANPEWVDVLEIGYREGMRQVRSRITLDLVHVITLNRVT